MYVCAQQQHQNKMDETTEWGHAQLGNDKWSQRICLSCACAYADWIFQRDFFKQNKTLFSFGLRLFFKPQPVSWTL
jgi:hypothetical protein